MEINTTKQKLELSNKELEDEKHLAKMFFELQRELNATKQKLELSNKELEDEKNLATMFETCTRDNIFAKFREVPHPIPIVVSSSLVIALGRFSPELLLRVETNW